MYVWDGERALHNDVIELLPENGMVDGVVRAAVADLHLAIEIPDARFEPFDTIGPAQIAADGDSISDEKTRNLMILMRIKIITIGICIAATWFVVSNTFSKGLSLADVDWDDSGQTSLTELWATIDYGVRPSADQPACREVFELKDGRPIKLLCP